MIREDALQRIVADSLASWGEKADANETALYTRALTQVMAAPVNVLYAPLKARQLFPIDTSVSNATEVVEWHQFDKVGEAQPVADYASDFARVEVIAGSFTSKVNAFGASYTYSLQEVRAAAQAGVPVPTMKAEACRNAIERRIERDAAFGDGGVKTYGLFNAPNMPESTINTDGGDTTWATKILNGATGKAAVLQDLLDLVSLVKTQSKGNHEATTIVLPPTLAQLLKKTPMSLEYQGKETLWSMAQALLPGVEMVEWEAAELGDSGTGPRIVAFQKDGQAMKLILPQDFEQSAPQQKSFAWTVNAHIRVGGIKFLYPLSAAFLDGAA